MFIERVLLVSKNNMYEIRYRSTPPQSYDIGLCGFVQTDKLELLLESVEHFNNSYHATEKGIELAVYPCDIKHSLRACDPYNMDCKKPFDYRKGYYKKELLNLRIYDVERGEW